jgi:hypothetical protein
LPSLTSPGLARKMLIGPAPVPLLTCLSHSPAVTTASWPD